MSIKVDDVQESGFILKILTFHGQIYKILNWTYCHCLNVNSVLIIPQHVEEFIIHNTFEKKCISADSMEKLWCSFSKFFRAVREYICPRKINQTAPIKGNGNCWQTVCSGNTKWLKYVSYTPSKIYYPRNSDDNILDSCNWIFCCFLNFINYNMGLFRGWFQRSDERFHSVFLHYQHQQ